ncbi:MAG: lysine exporter LysO family protein [Sulfolobales archaeon]
MNRQSILLLAFFLAGFAVSTVLNLEEEVMRVWLERTLYLLLFVIGIAVSDEISKLRETHALAGKVARLLLSTISGSAIGGLLSGLVLAYSGSLSEAGCFSLICVVKYSMAISLGMGWYTFTGVLLGTHSYFLGFLGFMSNLLRELLTFTIYPLLPKKLAISGVSMGGATTMDTTLPIMHKFGGPKVSLLAFIHGTVLTLLIPILLPLVVNIV